MSVKQLLPLSIRDRLRPAWQGLQRWWQGCRRRLSESRLWPRPQEWHEVRRELPDISDSATLYRIAAQEFGILQVENEIVPFLDFVAAQQPKVVGEIGLKHGGNSFMFLRRLQHATVYLGMDLVLENTSKLKFYRRPGQQIHLLEGNSQLPEMVAKADRILGNRRFDFLFIDGDHEYDGVLEDFIQWYRLVRPGGLIAFHDIVPDQEARTGVRDQTSQLWGGGVHQLWAQLKRHFQHREFVDDWEQGGFGIGVITRPEQPTLDPELIQEWRSAGNPSTASA